MFKSHEDEAPCNSISPHLTCWYKAHRPAPQHLPLIAIPMAWNEPTAKQVDRSGRSLNYSTGKPQTSCPPVQGQRHYQQIQTQVHHNKRRHAHCPQSLRELVRTLSQSMKCCMAASPARPKKESLSKLVEDTVGTHHALCAPHSLFDGPRSRQVNQISLHGGDSHKRRPEGLRQVLLDLSRSYQSGVLAMYT